MADPQRVDVQAVEPRGDEREDGKPCKLGNPEDGGEDRILPLVAKDVFEVVDSQARGGGVARHEEHHRHRYPQQLVVARDDPEDFPQGSVRSGSSDLLFCEDQGERLERHHDYHQDDGEQEPGLLCIAEQVCEPTRDGDDAHDH